MTSKKNEKIQLLSKYKISLPCEFGSGKLSLGTRCMTVVLPVGSPRAVKQSKNKTKINKMHSKMDPSRLKIFNSVKNYTCQRYVSM